MGAWGACVRAWLVVPVGFDDLVVRHAGDPLQSVDVLCVGLHVRAHHKSSAFAQTVVPGITMRDSAYPKEDALVVQQLDQVVRRRGHEAARVELLGC